MRPKLLVVYLVLVLVPLGVLGWLGIKLVRDEQEMVRHRITGLLEDQLRSLDTEIARLIEQRQRDLLRLSENLSLGSWDLRDLVRDQAMIQQVFVLDAEGNLIHPPTASPASDSEKDFLIRTEKIWREKELLYQPQQQEESVSLTARSGKSNANQQTSQVQQPLPAVQMVENTPRTSGWYVWYWDRGIHLIFWRKAASGNTIGMELDRARLLMDIIALLPDTGTDTTGLPEGRIALVDSDDSIIYQWGEYQQGKDERPRVTAPLSYPLNAWRLEYYTPDDLYGGFSGKGIWLNLASGLIALALVLIGLAFYFYWENTRELRLAAQRVTFVNQVSHELKTPLTNIRMYAELLEKELVENLHSESGLLTDSEGPGKLYRYLSVIVTESGRLSRLIGNILTFSRGQRRKLVLHPKAAVVDEVIVSVLENFRPSLQSKNVKVEISQGAPNRVSLDPDALEQILGNLFSNVEKYGAGGGWMGVTSQQQDNRTVITVSDRGPGIPTREREKIFLPFYRLSDKLSDGVTGTGIGLSIARDLARMHGGDLTLLPSDKGAVFQVELRTPIV